MNRKTFGRVAAGALAFVASAGAFVVTMDSSAGAVKPLARAELRNADNAVIGEVVFKGSGRHAERVEVEIWLPAQGTTGTTAPGLGAFHGLHVHAVGTCTAPFTSAGGHWNLDTTKRHGNHTGDLPSVLVGPDGRASAEFETHRFDVSGLFDSDGSAVVLHAGVDNFGNVPITTGKYEDPNDWYDAATGTGNTGDAGSRYGCGEVEAI